MKIDEYGRSINTASLVNSTTKREYRFSKQLDFLDNLLEITMSYANLILPEDLIYVVILLNEKAFACHHYHIDQVSSPLQPDLNGFPEHGLIIREPAHIQCEMTQKFFLFSFSLLLEKGDKNSIEEWIYSHPVVHQILEQCFSYYYPLFTSISKEVDGDEYSRQNFNSLNYKRKSKLQKSMTYNRQQYKFDHINTLGVSLLNIKFKDIRKMVKSSMASDKINHMLKDAVNFCVMSQFWPGYLQVLLKCPVDMRWEELDRILSLQNTKTLGYLNLINTKKDCIKVLDHINSMVERNGSLVKGNFIIIIDSRRTFTMCYSTL